MDPARRRLPWFLTLALIAAASRPAAAAPQLIARMNAWAPPSWAYGIVPRTTAGADSTGPVTASDSLLGTQPTYLNWSTWKNPAVCGTWTDQLRLDGQVVQSIVRSDCIWAEKYFPSTNQPLLIRGGRHTLEGIPDVDHVVANDHSFPPYLSYLQRVWSPASLTGSVGLGSSAPPDRGAYPPSNCDAYRIDRGNAYAWVVAANTAGASNDLDLVVYDDPWQGGNSGLTHEVGRSALAPGQTEFVVGASSSAATPYFPAVMRGAGPAGNYVIQWADATGRRGTPDVEWPPQSLTATGFAQVYEILFQAGVPTRIDLTRIGGTDDLTFSIFPPTVDAVWTRSQAIANASPYLGQEYDVLTFTASETGWHPLVVYRAGYDGSVANYVLRVGSNATLGVDGSGGPLFVAPPSPNPAARTTRFLYGLPAMGAVRITIHDAQGRRVRTLRDGTESAGRHDVAWDLRDDGGTLVGPGLYWATFEGMGRTLTKRLTVLR